MCYEHSRANSNRKDQNPAPERLAEVEGFVDFLVAKERGDAFDAFLSVAETVAKAGVPALTAEEIEAEIKAYRDARRRAAGT